MLQPVFVDTSSGSSSSFFIFFRMLIIMVDLLAKYKLKQVMFVYGPIVFRIREKILRIQIRILTKNNIPDPDPAWNHSMLLHWGVFLIY